jgi:hypothetical protein
MREIRPSGSEGGGTQVLPTPIYKAEFHPPRAATPVRDFAKVTAGDLLPLVLGRPTVAP